VIEVFSHACREPNSLAGQSHRYPFGAKTLNALIELGTLPAKKSERCLDKLGRCVEEDGPMTAVRNDP
jgi:hypothetical protein